MNKEASMNLIMLVVFIAIMYFLLIRPQKKKEKEVEAMRNSIQVGDEIVTIGGICGKVVKTKEDSFVIQVGADRVKFEITKWSVSTVTSKKEERVEKKEKEKKEEKAEAPAKPKRLDKKEEKEDKTEENK